MKYFGPPQNFWAGCATGSMRRVWALRHQTGAQYSAVDWTRARVAIRRVVAPAPQPEPASRLRSVMRDVSFLRSDSRCRPHVSDLRLHQHAWLLDRQHMHTFWRRWPAGQRCRCWREGAPGQIPVGRRSWGVVTCFFCRFRWLGWSCDYQPSPWSCGPCV